jgi:hypothetical protein
MKQLKFILPTLVFCSFTALAQIAKSVLPPPPLPAPVLLLPPPPPPDLKVVSKFDRKHSQKFLEANRKRNVREPLAPPPPPPAPPALPEEK